MSEEKKEFKADSIEEAANYLAEQKAKYERGELTIIDPAITTATSPERREFLNYCISLMEDRLMKYKILLFLRVNPYHEDCQGNEWYLSKAQIARYLTERLDRRVLETEVDGIERDAMKYAKDAITQTKANKIPILA